MAKYKVVLTVKDRYGNTKELDAGDIDIDLDKDDVDTIVDSVKENLNIETKSPVYVPEVTQNNMLKFKLTEDATKEELEFDIDRSNDWNKIEQTSGSNYVWEPMK